MRLAEASSAQLPTLRDFVVSPGFGGALILLASIIVFCAVLYASRRAGRPARQAACAARCPPPGSPG